MTKSFRLLPFHLKQVFSPKRSPLFLPFTMLKSLIIHRSINFLSLVLLTVSDEFLLGISGLEFVGISIISLFSLKYLLNVTVSCKFEHLALKSPCTIILPSDANLEISLSTSSKYRYVITFYFGAMASNENQL